MYAVVTSTVDCCRYGVAGVEEGVMGGGFGEGVRGCRCCKVINHGMPSNHCLHLERNHCHYAHHIIIHITSFPLNCVCVCFCVLVCVKWPLNCHRFVVAMVIINWQLNADGIGM